jgi:hypothetical protein
MTKYIFQRTQQTLIVLMMRECEECYDKLEELFDTRKSRSKKGVSTSMWNICNSNL